MKMIIVTVKLENNWNVNRDHKSPDWNLIAFEFAGDYKTFV